MHPHRRPLHELRVQRGSALRHPKLIGVLEQLLGGPVWVHPRHIVHAIFPADHDYTTPPHQAFHPARGAPDIWTAWVPFGDCDAPR